MNMSDVKISLSVALGVFVMWLVLDGSVLHAVAALLFAGLVPFTGYTIPAHYMLLFWLFCAGVLVHYFSRPHVVAFIENIQDEESASSGIPPATSPVFYETAIRKPRPVSARRRPVRRAGQDVR